jgi:hypothetical protein
MDKQIDEYLDRLNNELKGCDRSLIQDALADAREHLSTALDNALKEAPRLKREEVWQRVVDKFGTAVEVASAYREAETRLGSRLTSIRPSRQKPVLSRFLGALADARAWGAFIYALLSFLTGLVYCSWAIVGGLFSVLALFFIFGIPFAGLFLFSLRGIALVEGRVVEALLAVRMPRKPLFVSPDLKWTAKIKTLFFAAQTWKALVYFILQFPLGVLYLFVIGGLFVFSLAFIASPVLEWGFHLPLELLGAEAFTPAWLLPLVCLAGFVLLPLTLHLAKWAGKLHGRYAKAMLVKD